LEHAALRLAGPGAALWATPLILQKTPLTSRWIFSGADVQKIKLRGDVTQMSWQLTGVRLNIHAPDP